MAPHGRTRSRISAHYTPTYASWLNQVEIWFSLMTQRAIRRGTFRSVRDVVARIDEFVHHYNHHGHPFVWTATADSILEKIERLCKAIAGTSHSRERPASLPAGRIVGIIRQRNRLVLAPAIEPAVRRQAQTESRLPRD